MNHVQAISGRLSLRALQRESIKRLERVCDLIPLSKGRDLPAALADAHDTCRFNEVPEMLAESRWGREDRLVLARVVRQYADRADHGDASALRTLADKISEPGRRSARSCSKGEAS
jgi:hypothetical protein